MLYMEWDTNGPPMKSLYTSHIPLVSMKSIPWYLFERVVRGKAVDVVIHVFSNIPGTLFFMNSLCFSTMLSAEKGSPFYLSSQHYLAADYNFRLKPNFTLFAGLEAGVSCSYKLSQNYNNYGLTGLVEGNSEPFYTSKPVSPYFAPRVGFELWDRLRGTFSVGFMDKGDSNVNFRLGYVFGGSRK